MDATLYAGAGTTQSVVNAAGFKPDLFWLKNRSAINAHYLYDSVRGPLISLSSNDTAAEQNIAQTLTSFNSNGATLGTIGGGINGSGNNFVAWQWQAGQGTTSNNTSGSIASVVSVNQTAGFSIVTFTGTGSVGTVGHGLGVAPKMIIWKPRNQVNNWNTYHASIGNTGAVQLNLTSATSTDINYWNNTSPTSSVFTVGSYTSPSAINCVAYCWAEVAGFSQFGSYTGNGSTDGPFVYTGFRPKFIMIKATQTVDYGYWDMYDTSRSTYNVLNRNLYANYAFAEDSDAAGAKDVLSNGFKLRGTVDNANGNGKNYIYMAFAENPFKYANAR